MKSRRRSLPVTMLVIASGLCLTSPPMTAQEAPLGEVELPATAIVVDLEAARVRIQFGENGKPGVRWWRVSSEEPGSDELLVSGDVAAVVIERPAINEGDTYARLHVEIVSYTARPVRVFGSGIDLSIENEPTADVAAPVGEGGDAAVTEATVELQLMDSQAVLAGVGGVSGTIERSVALLRETRGLHRFEAVDSQLRFDDHVGTVTLSGQGVESVADDLKGQFSFQGIGGSIDLNSGAGRFNVRAEGTQVQLLDWRGTGTANLTDSSLDLRDSVLRNLNIKGVSTHATISGCDVTSTMELRGGSLVSDGTVGALTGTALDAASFEITDHRGNLGLTLQQDSSADLNAIQGEVKINARGARLEINEVGGLSFTAYESRASLAAISKLISFQVNSSEIVLDLSGCTNRKAAVSVSGESFVRVFLSTPCRVQTMGGSSSLVSRIDVAGCEYRVGQRRKWPSRNVRGLDGREPVMLTATVAADAELMVEGRP